MKKTILIIALVLMSSVSMWAEIPTAVVDGIKYELYGDARIMGHESELAEHLVVPDHITVDGVTYAVVSIKKNAFLGADNLKSVVLPNTIESITDYAFQFCSALESITLPDSLRNLDHQVFASTNLKKLIIPASVGYLADMAFYNIANLEMIEFKRPTPAGPGTRLFLLTDKAKIFVPNMEAYEAYIRHASYQQYASRIYPKEECKDFVKNQLDAFMTELMDGETPSVEIATIVATATTNITQAVDALTAVNVVDTAKLNIGTQYIAERKAAITAAKGDMDNEAINTLAADYLTAIDNAGHDLARVRRLGVAGVAAVGAFGQGYTLGASSVEPFPVPTEPGIRMQVITQDNKVYEFQASNVQKVEWKNVTE